MADEQPNRDFDVWQTRRRAARTEETVRILGHDVPVPRHISIDLSMRIDEADVENLDTIRELVAELFGPDELQRWRDGGMALDEFVVLLVWGQMSAQGDDIGFEEVAEIIDRRRVEEREGKAPGNRAERRAGKKSKR